MICAAGAALSQQVRIARSRAEPRTGPRCGYSDEKRNHSDRRRDSEEVRNCEKEDADAGDQPDLGVRAAVGRQGQGGAVHHSACG